MIFIKVSKLFFLLLFLLNTSITVLAQKPSSKPNILWLTFEDTSPQYIGCYGNNAAKTPVMDGLASEGLRFTSAFSTGTVCSPSRYALITGTRPTKYGTGHHRSSYAVPNFIEAFPTYLRQQGYYTSNNSKTDYNTSKARHFIQTAWDESSNNAGWWKRKDGQPFFSVFNCAHSHQSRVMTNPWWRYKEQILDNIDTGDVIKDDAFDMPPYLYDSNAMRKEHSRVYNSIQLTDKFFGDILERLENEGLRDNTIVFCFSDHGEGIVGGKAHARAMGYRVPLIVWIPEKYKYLSPWGSGGVIVNDVVDFTDLTATVLTLCGIQSPDYIEGFPIFGNDEKPKRQYSYGSLDKTGENLTLSRSITDGRWMYNHHFMPFQPEMRWQKYFDASKQNDLIRDDFKKGRLNKTQSYIIEELSSATFFDLENDEWEVHNLINKKGLSQEIAKMKDLLKQELINKRDAHFIPEYSHKISGLSPYELSRDEEFYPVKKVVETAFLIGEKNKIKELLNASDNRNDIVRYWSAIGLYSHCRMFGFNKCMSDLQDDNYPPADIFIQAIKAFYLNNTRAETSLLEYMKGDSLELALLAAELMLLQDQLSIETYNKFIEITSSSEHEVFKQCGELLEYKVSNKELKYKTFW
ncbi:sulfatase family protein [Saccharicrinis aurantiacus]|uniref:sulfatase family protein n=1 Tax=Saccharicrinis aurantiacus TaxID=1849719 RepID=UPI002491B3DF|nr:sulfatase [Saccharicrinis aurantiacus]